MIELRKVTQENYKEVAQLRVTAKQEEFVALNWYSLLEANYEEEHYPSAIYKGEELVGFLLYAYYPADEDYPKDSWWILRLMIDKEHQNKGYGKEAMKQFETCFKKSYDVDELRISAEPENKVAIKLYEDLGFEQTGETVEGETVLLKRW